MTDLDLGGIQILINGGGMTDIDLDGIQILVNCGVDVLEPFRLFVSREAVVRHSVEEGEVIRRQTVLPRAGADHPDVQTRGKAANRLRLHQLMKGNGADWVLNSRVSYCL